MKILKLFFKIIIILIFILSIFFGIAYFNQDIVATIAFDHSIDKAITKVEQKVPGLSLDYQENSTDFGIRSGVINWTLDMDNIPSFLKGISGATNVKIDFENIEKKQVKGSFESVDYVGSISSIFTQFGLPNFHYEGIFEASYDGNKVNGFVEARTNGFTLTSPDGNCVIGGMRIYSQLLNINKVKTDIYFDGINCKGSLIYNSKPNVVAHLQDIKLSFISHLKEKNFFDKKKLSFSSFLFDFSTIYAIGFDPYANVRDKSLRDAFSIENFESNFDFFKRENGFKDVLFDGNFIVKIAMPSVKDNTNQIPFIADNAKLNFELKSINFDYLKNVLKADDIVSALLNVISNNFVFNLKEASFYTNNSKTSIQGYLDLNLNKIDLKQSKVNSLFDINIGKGLFEALPKSYSLDMKNAVEDKRFNETKTSYQTTIKVINNKILLNNEYFSEKDLDDNLKEDSFEEYEY